MSALVTPEMAEKFREAWHKADQYNKVLEGEFFVPASRVEAGLRAVLPMIEKIVIESAHVCEGQRQLARMVEAIVENPAPKTAEAIRTKTITEVLGWLTSPEVQEYIQNFGPLGYRPGQDPYENAYEAAGGILTALAQRWEETHS